MARRPAGRARDGAADRIGAGTRDLLVAARDRSRRRRRRRRRGPARAPTRGRRARRAGGRCGGRRHTTARASAVAAPVAAGRALAGDRRARTERRGIHDRGQRPPRRPPVGPALQPRSPRAAAQPAALRGDPEDQPADDVGRGGRPDRGCRRGGGRQPGADQGGHGARRRHRGGNGRPRGPRGGPGGERQRQRGGGPDRARAPFRRAASRACPAAVPVDLRGGDLRRDRRRSQIATSTTSRATGPSSCAWSRSARRISR